MPLGGQEVQSLHHDLYSWQARRGSLKSTHFRANCLVGISDLPPVVSMNPGMDPTLTSPQTRSDVRSGVPQPDSRG